MVAVRKFQVCLRVLAVCLSLTALAAPLSAQTNTTIRVGVPSIPGQPQVYESVSTNQIDLALANRLPGRYPLNYTSDKAEAAFQSLADLRQDLIVDVRNALLAEPDINRVFNVSVELNPINAHLTQQGTSIQLELSSIDFAIAAELRTYGGYIGGIFCSTPDVNFAVEDIVGTGNYNVYTGAIGIVRVSYESFDVDADCDGLLGFIGDMIVDLFGSTIDGLAAAAIEDAIANVEGIDNKQTLFSVRAFFEGLLDSDVLDSVNSGKALDALDEIVMQTDLDSGLVLDITINDGVTNTITFLASHKPPIFGASGAPSSTTRSLRIRLPDQSEKVVVYRRATNGSWLYLTTLTHDATITFPYGRFFAEITAVSYSDLISGLKSTDNPRSYFWDPTTEGGGRK